MGSSLQQRLADDIELGAERYADLVLEMLAAEVPEVISDPARRRLAHAGSAALLREFAGALRNELGDVRYHAPAAALAFGRHLAREGVQLSSIMRSYRLGQEVLFGRAAELAGGGPQGAGAVAELARVAALSFRFSDDAMSDVAQEYETQRELFIRGTLAQRALVLRTLLAGRPVDPELAERTLSRRLDGHHVAVVAWVSEPAADDDAPAQAARELAEAIGEGRALVIADTPGEATAWITPRGPAQTAQLQRLLPQGIRAAIGRPGHGVEGFAASLRQAELARSVSAGGLTLYEDVALAALLLRDRAAAIAFCREELGELAGAGRSARELRATLLALHACAHDRTRAASTLGVHRNTVSARLRRAQALLGRPPDERAVELQAALAISAALGD